MNSELKQNLQTINNHLDNLKHDYGVKKVGIFGSFIKNKQTPKSDIDILIEFKKPIGLFRFVELEDRLSKLLGRKVDLVTKNALKPAMKQQVLKNVVYAQ